MQPSKFESRLKRARLSSPGVSFEEIATRVESRAPRRPGRGLLRLAVAAAAVWLVVCLVHVALDRSIDAVAPGAPALVAEGNTGAPVAGNPAAGLAARQKLMQALIAEGMPPEGLPRAPRGPSKPDGRSSAMPAEPGSPSPREQLVPPHGGAVV